MPKLKTNKSAVKRFRITPTGKVVGRRQSAQHRVAGKSRQSIQAASYDLVLKKGDAKRVKRLIPNS